MATERLQTIKRHLNPAPTTGNNLNVQKNTIPKRRQELLKWNGWGYKNCFFFSEDNGDEIHLGFSGDRYFPAGKTRLPKFSDWAIKMLNLNKDYRTPAQPAIPDDELPQPTINEPFLNGIKNYNISFSFDPQDRLFRAHGHTLREIYILRKRKFDRIPDLVVWPECHEDVVKLVDLATLHNVVLIPFGGGTSVSGALECPTEERRMIVSLDTSQMNKLLWVDQTNLTAHFQAGIIGQDLQAVLESHGLCLGHEPDSYEFSSLGGWVATRASGMKKNIYGNIEDMLVYVKMVTPQGVIEKNCHAPRMSSGPDIYHFVLGSEGTLGVVTEVTLKVRPLPECVRYGSIVLPNFESGVKVLREVALQQLRPASIRLMDNEQFIFGQALKPESTSYFSSFMDGLKKFYITQLKGFDVNKMCVITLLFEGTKEDVEILEKKINSIAAKYGGLPAGEENGKRGYMLTFVIAYIRDIGMDFGVIGESFETAVPWDRVLELCRNVKERIHREAVKQSLKYPAFISCRVTQSYDAGACVYFYFAFNAKDLEDPVHIYEEIETAARDEIIASGGSISHHHGVGKVRKRWLRQTISDPGMGILNAVKSYLDPKNIFANGNLML